MSKILSYLQIWNIRKYSFFPYLVAAKEFSIGLSNRDFSQFGEQTLLSRHIPKTPGYYLDIGSGRPVSGSNTFFLYRQGWTGILVDPIKSNITAIRIVRKRDVHFNLLVGNLERQNFFEFFPYEYSTTSSEIAADLALKKNVELVSSYELEAKSADYFYKLLPSDCFIVVNIDAEGADYEVLQSLDLQQNRPNIILIEDWDYSPENETSIEKFITNFGYKLLARAGLTSIYKI